MTIASLIDVSSAAFYLLMTISGVFHVTDNFA